MEIGDRQMKHPVYTHEELKGLMVMQTYPIMTRYLNQAIEEEKAGVKGQVKKAMTYPSVCYYEIMYQVPYKDLPLHINEHSGPIYHHIIKWRLGIGK